MIRKVITNINSNNKLSNNDNKDSNVGSNYDIDSKNAEVESFNLDSFTNNSSYTDTIVTEETVLEAIENNFTNNRNITNDVNNQIYNSFNEKINNYISNNKGSF